MIFFSFFLFDLCFFSKPPLEIFDGGGLWNVLGYEFDTLWFEMCLAEFLWPSSFLLGESALIMEDRG